jgi:hypothetical protein
MEKQEKSFICPFCKEKQTEIGQSQNTDVLYKLDLTTENYAEFDQIFADNGNYWFCLNCDNDLDVRHENLKHLDLINF